MFAKMVGRRATALATSLAVVIGLAITPAFTATAAEGDEAVIAPQTTEVVVEETPPAAPPAPAEEAPAAPAPVEELPAELPAEEVPVEEVPAELIPADASTPPAPESMMRPSVPEPVSLMAAQAAGISPASIGDFVVGAPVDIQFSGVNAERWRVVLDSWTDVNMSTSGHLTGSFSRVGSHSLTVQAQNRHWLWGWENVASERYTFSVLPAVFTTSLPDATVGVAYNQTLDATRNNAALVDDKFTLVSGSLPAGLSLNRASGKIAGTVTTIPTSPVTYDFTVRLTHDFWLGGSYHSAPQPLSITVGYPAPIVTTTALPEATVGVAYPATQLKASGDGVITWTATGLPAGLQLDAATGIISGTPHYNAALGASATVQVTVTASNGRDSTPQSLPLTVITPAPELDRVSVPDATVGVPYSHQLTVTNGFGALRYKLTNLAVLPDGLELSESGLISGTPTYDATAGSSLLVKFRVRVDGTAGHDAQNFSIILNTPAPVLDRASLPSTTVGVPYSHQLTVTNGFGDLKYKLTNKSVLPDGLHLSEDGLIYGTPTYDATAGASSLFNFRVRVDGTAGHDARNFSIILKTPAPTIETDALSDGWLKQAYSHAVTTTGPGVTVTVENLPNNLTFDGTTISGKSATAGTFWLKVTAANTAGSVTEWVPLTINDKPALTAMAPVTVETGTLYAFTPGVSGQSVTLALRADAPAGMTMDLSGNVEWTPTAAGLYEYWVTATNPAGAVTKRYTVRVLDAPVLTQGALVDGVIGVPYQLTVAHDGTDVRLTVIAGSLPTGLALSSAGVLEGTPGEAGTFDFRVRAFNGVGIAYQWFTLTILEPAMQLSTGSILRGGSLTVTGSGYMPGDQLELWLHSTPVLLGTVTSVDGTFTKSVTIPANVPAGAHDLVVTGAQSGTQSMPLTVTAAPAPPAAPQQTRATTQSPAPLTVTPAEESTTVDDADEADDSEVEETEADEELPTLPEPQADEESTPATPVNWTGLLVAGFALLLAALALWFILWRRRRAQES